MVREGFRHLTIGDLAGRLHCSRRTLYSLAPSKEDLVLLALGRLLDRTGASARRRAEEGADPGVRIEAYLEAAIEPLRAASPAFGADVQAYAPTKRLYDRHQELAIGALERLVDEGARSGAFRRANPALIAQILDAALTRLRDPAVHEKAGVTRPEAFAELATLLRHGLHPPPPTP